MRCRIDSTRKRRARYRIASRRRKTVDELDKQNLVEQTKQLMKKIQIERGDFIERGKEELA